MEMVYFWNQGWIQQTPYIGDKTTTTKLGELSNLKSIKFWENFPKGGKGSQISIWNSQTKKKEKEGIMDKFDEFYD